MIPHDPIRFLFGPLHMIPKWSIAVSSFSIILDQIQTPVRDGASKGKVERAFRTLKNRWLHGLDIASVTSLEQFNALLSDYIRTHNTTLHSSIQCTPMERFMASKAHISTPKSSEWLDECFHNRITRKVNNDSCVSINKVAYDAPQSFIGMKVDIRFLPDRMEEAFILYEGKHYPLHATDKVANSMTKRNNKFDPLDYSKRGGAKHE